MHSRNIHRDGYDFPALVRSFPELEDYMFHNAHGNLSIDFGNPKAVKVLNSALLKHYYGIDYWDFPDQHLCPPIPSRVEYIHLLKDLLDASEIHEDINILDIGTGATCIYPLLGKATYGWNFTGSDVDEQSLQNAQMIIDKNNLKDAIELRFQKHPKYILESIILPSESITATLCNPPFYKNEAQALANTSRKLKGLGKSSEDIIRNFSGTAKELWYPGGEERFLKNYMTESAKFHSNVKWFTSLVSKKDHVRPMKVTLKKLGVKEVKVLDLSLGNKKSRVVAWTFE